MQVFLCVFAVCVHPWELWEHGCVLTADSQVCFQNQQLTGFRTC